MPLSRPPRAASLLTPSGVEEWKRWFDSLWTWLTEDFTLTVTLADSLGLDAFGRLKVNSATLVPLFDNTHEYGDNPFFWEQSVNGGSVAHQSGTAAMRLSTGGTTNGNYAVHQTKQPFRYKPGRSLNVERTFVMSAAQTNGVCRVGWFSNRDGIFLERKGATINLVRRYSTNTDIITNGGFGSATTGWTAGAGSIARTTAFGGGELTVTNPGGGGGNGYAYQAITTVVGVRYTIGVIARCGTATSVQLRIGTSQGGAELGLATTTNTGATATRQGDRISVTFTATGTTTYVGLYNVDSTASATGIYDEVQAAAIDEVVPQSSWNLDPLNGSGASRVTLDFTKTQILGLQMQLLQVGRVQVYFVIDGKPIAAHEFKHANTLSVPYVSTACLPLRDEVVNEGTGGGTVTMDVICASVSSGGEGAERLQFDVGNEVGSFRNTSTTYLPLVSIRAATLLGGSTGTLRNRAHIRPKVIDVTVTDRVHQWALFLNPTLGSGGTPPSWTAVGATSMAEYDITATTITGGTKVASGFVQASASARGSVSEGISITLPLVYTPLLNVQDVLTLAVKTGTLTGTAAAQIEWEEEY